jgi:phytoene synthase
MSGNDHSAQEFCADQVRARDFTSYAASLFVPPEPRRAWLALAAFNTEVAHIRDHISQPLPGEIRLQWWRDTLTGEGAAIAQDAQENVQANPVAAELLRAVKRYGLPFEMLVRLIDAHVFDVYDDPMPDMAALEAHCRDTSAALFALRARILGAALPEISQLADHAGIAEGLVDVMLSLPKHAARRQLYLPADLMNSKGAIAEETFARHVAEPLQQVLAHLHGEARTQLDAAMAMLRDAPREARPAFLPLASVRRNLERLERADPFNQPLPSRLSVLWTMWCASRLQPFKA